MCFSANVGRHFFPNFERFGQIFRDFSRIFDKSQFLGERLYTLHPRLLHHWMRLTRGKNVGICDHFTVMIRASVQVVFVNA